MINEEEHVQKRNWIWPAVVTTIILVLIVSAFALMFGSRTEKLTGERISVNHEVALRHVATLTDKDTKFTIGGPNWRDAIWSKIPEAIRMRFFSGYLPSAPFEVTYSSIDPGDVRLIMRVEYPKTWLPTANQWDIDRKIDTALEDAGMKYYRVVQGKSFNSSQSSIDLSSGPGVYAHGKLTEAKPYVTLTARDVPFFARELELQFIEGWNENSTVTQTMVFQNPYWQKVDPLPEPAPLPQTVADRDLEVTLRNVVSKTIEDVHVDFRTSNGEEVVVARPVGKAVPVSDALPPDFFPRADEESADPYHSMAVFAINHKGRAEPEWGVSDIDLLYGKSLHEWGISSWSSMGEPAAYFIRFSGDLTAIDQPVKVVATLNRQKNYPPDELQTVLLPLPKEGEAVTSGAEVVLWDNRIKVEQIAYKVRSANTDFISPNPDMLSILMRGQRNYGSLKEPFLMKDDGSTVSLSYLMSSSGSSDKGAAYHYDLSRRSGWQRDSKPLVYEEYTSIGLTFISPRPYPKKFEFVARPVDATGKYVPDK